MIRAAWQLTVVANGHKDDRHRRATVGMHLWALGIGARLEGHVQAT